MKKLFTLLLAATLFVGCNNTKTDKAVPLAGTILEDGTIMKVESASVTVSLNVINKTDMDLYVNCSFCVDAVNDTTLVKSNASYLLQSNNQKASGTIFTIGIHGPKDGCGGYDPLAVNPSGWGGQLPVGYGYWEGSAHVTTQPEQGNANPTAKVPDYDGNWIFEYSFKDGSHNAQVFDEVTITTKCTK